MSSRRARTRPTTDAESGQPDQPTPPPPPPEIPQREEASEETPRTGSEADVSGTNAGGGGDTEVGASIDSGAMRSAVLEALSDPAVVRQLAAAVSNSSTSSASTSASTHEGKTE